MVTVQVNNTSMTLVLRMGSAISILYSILVMTVAFNCEMGMQKSQVEIVIKSTLKWTGTYDNSLH